MKAEYINPFIASMISVFDTMLGSALTRGAPYLKKSVQPDYEVGGVIGLTGRARGVVVLSFCREAALSATEVMLGERPAEINSDVTDAVGELANMVAGSAKAQLGHLNLSISLPTIIVGKWHSIQFPKHTVPICIPFECPWGPVAATVGLVEQSLPVEQQAATALVMEPPLMTATR
jgi:chemotaxis protein CheX